MNEELDMELKQDVVSVQKRKPIVQETIVNLNEYFRIKITSNESSMELQKKRKYEDGSENWLDDGSFGWFDTLLKDAANTMRKEKLLLKQVNELEDLRNAILSTDKDIDDWCGISKEKIKSKLMEDVK